MRIGLGSDFDFVLFGKVNGSVGVFAQGGVVLVWSGVLSFIQQSSLIVSSFELGYS